MPRATVSLEPTEKTELKTCPPDGYVILKRMSYGMKLQRQELASKISMNISRGKRNQKADLDMLAAESTRFDFSHCIVDHNLEDEDGRKLNLSEPRDVAQLDPRVGEEISTLIDDLNNFELEDDDNPN